MVKKFFENIGEVRFSNVTGSASAPETATTFDIARYDDVILQVDTASLSTINTATTIDVLVYALASTTQSRINPTNSASTFTDDDDHPYAQWRFESPAGGDGDIIASRLLTTGPREVKIKLAENAGGIAHAFVRLSGRG